MKFHHVGIFVENVEKGVEEISKIIEISAISQLIEDNEIGVKIKFLKESSGIIYEIVAPLGNNSPVTGVIVRGHGFLNHIAYTTERFDEEINRLRSEGMVPLGPRKKAKAFLGAKVCFFLTRLGYIIELIDGKISVDLFLKNKLP